MSGKAIFHAQSVTRVAPALPAAQPAAPAVTPEQWNNWVDKRSRAVFWRLMEEHFAPELAKVLGRVTKDLSDELLAELAKRDARIWALEADLASTSRTVAALPEFRVRVREKAAP